jgi:uncharacterized protein (DUF2141 family)
MKGIKMSRYLKTLGLAMMVALALSAVTASVASAGVTTGKLTKETGTVTVTGTENPAGTNAFTAFGQETQCPESKYTAFETNTTPHATLPSGSTSATITPDYVNCENGSGAARTVKMNSCDFEFYDFTTTGGVEGTYGLLAGIVCNVPGDSITVEGGACKVHVPAQTGLTGLHATNVTGTPDRVRIHGEIHNVTAHTCLGITTKEARQHQDVTVEGFDALGAKKGITISH